MLPSALFFISERTAAHPLGGTRRPGAARRVHPRAAPGPAERGGRCRADAANTGHARSPSGNRHHADVSRRQRAPAQQARPFGAAVRLLEEPARHRTAPGAARRERGRGGLPERDAAAPGHRHRVDRADRAADRGGRQPEHTEQRGQHAPAHGLRGGQAGVCARAGAGRRQPGAAEPVRKDAARPGVPLAAPGAVRVGRKQAPGGLE